MARVGCVRYLNVGPMVEGLESVLGLEVESAVPSRIGPMLMGGEVDVGLVSVVDALGSGGGMTLVPVGMIGCRGPTLTVRLFSRVRPEAIERLHADTDSRTSVMLARVLLAARHGSRVSVVEFNAREGASVRAGGGGVGGGVMGEEEWPESLLLIGDKVVVGSPPAVRYPYQMDLGAAWLEWTGLPFVYAVWACRTADLADGAARGRIGTAAALLDRQRRRNAQRLEWVIERGAARSGWPVDLARRYLGELLRYEFGAEERRGLERFHAEVVEHVGVGEVGVGWRVPEMVSVGELVGGAGSGVVGGAGARVG